MRYCLTSTDLYFEIVCLPLAYFFLDVLDLNCRFTIVCGVIGLSVEGGGGVNMAWAFAVNSFRDFLKQQDLNKILPKGKITPWPRQNCALKKTLIIGK